VIGVFKSILILAIVFVSIQYMLVQRIAFYRLLFMAMAGGICVLIANPELSTRLANFFGIGRGVDFVLYLTQAFWAIVFLRLYQREKRHGQDLTELTRSLAILNARQGQ
jgi:hypothetical protein